MVVVGSDPWTTLRQTTGRWTPNPPDRLPPPDPKMSLFFSLSRLHFVLFVSLWVSPNVHISGPHHFKHHQNSTRRHPERLKNSDNVGGRGKNAKFLPPTLRDPPFGVPFFWDSGPNPFFLLFCFFFEKKGQKTETPILAKVGLAKVG